MTRSSSLFLLLGAATGERKGAVSIETANGKECWGCVTKREMIFGLRPSRAYGSTVASIPGSDAVRGSIR
jgi:hypothetical protein